MVNSVQAKNKDMVKLKSYIDERLIYWTKKVNENYKTDTNGDLTCYSKGVVNNLIEIKSFMEKNFSNH